MNLREAHEKYGAPKQAIEVLESLGIKKLYPPQAEAIREGVLEGKNLILAIPTAAGKTLVAELCMLKSIFEEGGNCLYIVPLRALASEKYKEFKKKYESIGVKVGVATGDYDVVSSELAQKDILIATSEKVDSLLRHRAKWLADLTTVAVFDEIHLIDDPGRGPTLEVLAARLRQLNPDLQILALSATISNSAEIADWLDAQHVRSNWRPVPLKEGVYMRGIITFEDLSEKKVKAPGKDKVSKIALDTIENNGGQVLVFVSKRRSTQVVARKASRWVREVLTQDERDKLEEISQAIETALGEPTETCHKLAKYVKSGTAFHHAGLHHRQRAGVEDAFRRNLIKIISATPTLAAGVNLPSQRVIIRDYKRYSPPYGMQPIPVLEYKQQAGRAGRPGFDDYGEAVLIASSEGEKETLLEEYIQAEPERIRSKLASKPALRTHILGSIAAGYVNSLTTMLEFIDHTFFAHQYSTERVRGLVEEVLDFLKEEEMISSKGKWLSASRFGKRVSQLYIDPLSGVVLRDALKELKDRPSELGLLHVVCSTPDMNTLYLRRGDFDELDSLVKDYAEAGKLIIRPPVQWQEPEKYEFYLAEIKTARMLQEWLKEKPEAEIHEKFGVGAGDIRRKVRTAEWLLYSAYRLAKLFKVRSAYSPLLKLSRRVRYGVKEELLELVGLRRVGRVRARSLFSAGYRSLGDLKRASISELTEISHIGPETAKSIMKQV